MAYKGGNSFISQKVIYSKRYVEYGFISVTYRETNTLYVYGQYQTFQCQ
jgi:hypothetical protein